MFICSCFHRLLENCRLRTMLMSPLMCGDAIEGCCYSADVCFPVQTEDRVSNLILYRHKQKKKQKKTNQPTKKRQFCCTSTVKLSSHQEHALRFLLPKALVTLCAEMGPNLIPDPHPVKMLGHRGVPEQHQTISSLKSRDLRSGFQRQIPLSRDRDQ